MRCLKQSLKKKPEDIGEEVLKSESVVGVGAGFPTGMKWKFLDRKSGKPIYLICNADESEPGTFKDRQIIHKDPHQLIEGMMISALLFRQSRHLYIYGQNFLKVRKFSNARLRKQKQKGFVGTISGSGYSCDLVVHRGMGAYICGEETGLIESLEGKRPNPRIKPLTFLQCWDSTNALPSLIMWKPSVMLSTSWKWEVRPFQRSVNPTIQEPEFGVCPVRSRIPVISNLNVVR